MTSRGVVAAGHPETVRAASNILDEGGNAYDAIIAAVFAACVVEPVLSSLGGGGFLLAAGPTLSGKERPVIYDFFTQTPKSNKAGSGLDFQPIIADFGTATQEFHIGLASVATPGIVKGVFKVHTDLCTMPMTRIIEPALELARKGFTVNRLQAYLFKVVGPIYMHSSESRAIFASIDDPKVTMGEGEHMVNPELADTLETLAKEGDDFFYRGEFASSVAELCRINGGLLTRDDFESYQVERRMPLAINYRGASLFTNPIPSTGGILIAFALDLLNSLDINEMSFGSLEYINTLVHVMDLTNQARIESGLCIDVGSKSAAEKLLNRKFLAEYQAEIINRPKSNKGTTHISIIDSDGRSASLTMSNGEGAGIILPGTGIMLNNMLGEEDLNPMGFHRWSKDTRLSSMMAPSLLREGNGSLTVLGSGGSNRIRTAILQVLVNLLNFSMSVEEAVEAPRIHFEANLLNMEEGFYLGDVTKLPTKYHNIKVWDDLNLFFGGTHVAKYESESRTFSGSGDPRRGGFVQIL